MTAEHPRSWIQKNYRSFNGIRGVAILMVFYSHFGPISAPRFLHTGIAWAGVDLFFVLSGFLITGILYESRDSLTYYRDFYIRRSLRILPLYWGLLLCVLLYSLVQHLGLGVVLIPDFLLIQNLAHRYIILHPSSSNPIYMQIGRSFPLEIGALWSLCIEEQFYLLWPTVLRRVKRRATLLRIALVGASSVLVIRTLVFWLDRQGVIATNYLYFQPYARFDSLLIGAALNLWLQRKKLTITQLRRVSRNAFVLTGGLLVCTLLIRWHKGDWDGANPVIATGGFTLIALASAALLLRSMDDTSRLSKLFRSKPLEGLGRISYGFYIFHYLFPHAYMQWADKHLQPERLLVLPVAFASTTTMAYLSFRFYESPFLRLKDRFAPSHRSIPSGRAGH